MKNAKGEIAGVFIRPVMLEKEINFEVFDDSGYISRLVPTLWGFEFSLLERSLGTIVAE